MMAFPWQSSMDCDKSFQSFANKVNLWKPSRSATPPTGKALAHVSPAHDEEVRAERRPFKETAASQALKKEPRHP
jgi:hypothetical protein